MVEVRIRTSVYFLTLYRKSNMSKLSVLNILIILAVLGFCTGAPKASEEKPINDSKTVTEKPSKRKHKETFIEVGYGKETVAVGNFLDPVQVKDVPVVEWKTEPDTLYTLLMIDLDSPSRANPVDADYVHWLTGNIPGSDIAKGTPIVDYIGAFPGKDTGIHNYMFMLYEQLEGKIDFTEKSISKTNGSARKNFDVAAFVKKYGFNNPLSFNLFKAEYDSYSDILRNQLDPKDSEHAKMDDVVKAPVMDVVKDPVMGVVKDPEMDVVKDPVMDVIKAPVMDFVKAPVMGVVKDPIMDVVNQITVAKPDINIQKPDEIQNSKSSTN